MSVLSAGLRRGLCSIKRYLERVVWPEHIIRWPAPLKKTFSAHPVIVADVGASGGVESPWKAVAEYVKFVTFEPDARSFGDATLSTSMAFPVGLGGKEGEAVLHLAEVPAISSLYRFNTEGLEDFAIAEAHHITGEAVIPLRTLDLCFSEHPEIAPDFLKIDVEGSDLDVLKGGTSTLAHVKGIQVEVSFWPRHQNAPLFGEVDAFLRERGYELFELHREHWIRKNRLYALDSQPQLIWADAVYFLSRRAFLARVRALPVICHSREVMAFVFLLLVFGVHDYALELVEEAMCSGLLSGEDGRMLLNAVKLSVEPRAWTLIRRIAGICAAAVAVVVVFPFRNLRRPACQYGRVQLRAMIKCLRNLLLNGPCGASLYD